MASPPLYRISQSGKFAYASDEVEKDKIVINFGCHANKINKTPA